MLKQILFSLALCLFLLSCETQTNKITTETVLTPKTLADKTIIDLSHDYSKETVY